MSGTGAAVNATAKVGRNESCPCGSGRKYKHCCQSKTSGAESVEIGPQPLPEAKTKAQAQKMAAGKHWAAGRRADAIAAFQEVVLLDPRNPDARHDLGVALFREGRLTEAMDSFRRAVELRPSFDKSLRPLAYVLEHLGMDREASLAYRRLSRGAGDALERRLLLAQALVLEGELEEAEKELRRVIAAAPGNAAARSLLGQLLMEQGSFEEGERQLIQVVDSVPDVFLRLSGARRMTEADRPLIERMRDLVERADLDPIPRGSVHFGLGKAFDDLGDAAEAMAHFDAGNRLKSMSARLNRGDLAAHYEGLGGLFRRGARAGGPTTDAPRRRRSGAAHRHAALGYDPGRANPLVASFSRRRRRAVVLEREGQAMAGSLRRDGRSRRPCFFGRTDPATVPVAGRGQGRRRPGRRQQRLAPYQVWPSGGGCARPGGRGLSGRTPRDRARRPPGDRQGAHKFRAAGADPAGRAESVRHSLPPAPGRHVPVDILHQFEVASGLEPGRSGVLVPSVRAPDGALAQRIAGQSIHRG
jgi:Flp pilus assembly protein TadD